MKPHTDPDEILHHDTIIFVRAIPTSDGVAVSYAFTFDYGDDERRGGPDGYVPTSQEAEFLIALLDKVAHMIKNAFIDRRLA